MQDGRRTLEPRATRTLLRIDGNEREVARIRGTSSGPEKENERKRERRTKRRKTKEEERGSKSNTRTEEKKGDEDREREMNNARGRRGNTEKGGQGDTPT